MGQRARSHVPAIAARSMQFSYRKCWLKAKAPVPQFCTAQWWEFCGRSVTLPLAKPCNGHGLSLTLWSMSDVQLPCVMIKWQQKLYMYILCMYRWWLISAADWTFLKHPDLSRRPHKNHGETAKWLKTWWLQATDLYQKPGTVALGLIIFMIPSKEGTT